MRKPTPKTHCRYHCKECDFYTDDYGDYNTHDCREEKPRKVIASRSRNKKVMGGPPDHDEPIGMAKT